MWKKGRPHKQWSKLLLKETRKEQNIVKARREEGNNQIVITKSWEQWNGKQKKWEESIETKNQFFYTQQLKHLTKMILKIHTYMHMLTCKYTH